jgi:hypothetical protein
MELTNKDKEIDYELIELINRPAFLWWYYDNFQNGFTTKKEFKDKFIKACENGVFRKYKILEKTNYIKFKNAKTETLYMHGGKLLCKEEKDYNSLKEQKVYDLVGGVLRNLELIN